MFRKTARNFNLPAATCGKVCVAEVEEIVPVGSLDPDCIHLPSIYVNRPDPRRALRQEDRVPHRAATGGGMKRGSRSPRLLLAGCATAPAPVAPLVRRQVRCRRVCSTLWLGRSGGDQSQAFNALLRQRCLLRLARDRAGTPATGDHFSAVLAPGSTLDNPAMLPCGDKPRAVVFDVDETVLLNLGFEADDAAHPDRPYDAARWQDWERTGVDAVAPVPGALDAVKVLRTAGVTVIFNTNRSAGTAAFTEAALDHAGFGPVRHGETLWLKGDLGADRARTRAALRSRANIALSRWEATSSETSPTPLPERPGNVARPRGRRPWPLFSAGSGSCFPIPVYGTALKGEFDDVFPADKRWTDAGGGR